MDRRKFFSFLAALPALPAICKNLVTEQKRFWAGTTIPRSNPWQELEESEKRLIAASRNFTSGTTQTYQYSYFLVNSKGQFTAPTPFTSNTIALYRCTDD